MQEDLAAATRSPFSHVAHKAEVKQRETERRLFPPSAGFLPALDGRRLRRLSMRDDGHRLIWCQPARGSCARTARRDSTAAAPRPSRQPPLPDAAACATTRHITPWGNTTCRARRSTFDAEAQGAITVHYENKRGRGDRSLFRWPGNDQRS